MEGSARPGRWVRTWRPDAVDVPAEFNEDCVALLDSDRPAALALARFLGQTSIFEWTADSWEVITLDGTRFPRGWTTTPAGQG